jgi:hypothetical protein
MNSIDTMKPERKSGGSREPALSEVERGPAVRLSRTQMTGAPHSRNQIPRFANHSNFVHEERTPDFLLRSTHQRPRVRLSLRKAA